MKKIVFINPTGDVDIRLYKFLKFFQNQYEVFLISPQYSQVGHKKLFKDLEYEKINKIDVSCTYNVNFPFDFKRNKKIRKALINIQPDIVVCRDIMISGFLNKNLKVILNTNFILDVCDSFPEVLKVMFGLKGKILSFIANKVEKKALKLFNKILFVSPEAKEFILKKHNLEKDNYILENVPYVMNKQKSLFKLNNNKLVYLGTINKKIRDLETVFKGICILNEVYGQKFTLDIYYFENQKDIKEEYERIVTKMQLDEFVYFKKAVSNDILRKILQEYSIGLVPHCRNDATDYTIPNKIYDYINSDLFILASDNSSLKRLLDFWSVGATYQGENAKDFANTIINIRAKVSQSSANINKINRELNWEHQVKGLML
jgi:hypothetical protein